MSRIQKRSLAYQLLLCGSAVFSATTFVCVGPGLGRVRAALQDSPKTVIDEAWQIVNREYVDDKFNQVNWQAIRQDLLSKEYTSREQAYAALKNALEKLNDPYTRFMDPKQYEALTSQTSGELSGIGIRLEVNDRTKQLMVVEPIENSPAMKAGIQAGDQILQIDGKSTKGMTVEQASNLIRGEAGSKILLQVGRGSQQLNLALTRARIELPTVRYSLKQDGDRRVGYIRLNEFSSHAAEQMRKAIQDLSVKNVEGFVLDLRGNPGGLLQSSIEISRMWLNHGEIVRTVDRQGNNEDISANQTALTRLPLVVLVDGNSASSSEILTGALKDNNRATIVGTQTFGKALVQSVHALSDGSGLAVTIAHYYTPKGTDISHKGIAPDVQIEMTEAQRKQLTSNPKLIATLEDPQYAQAIRVLQQVARGQANPVTTTTTQKLLPTQQATTTKAPVRSE